MTYTIKALDESTWDAFAALVEHNNGVFGGCWCMGFHPEGVHNKDTTPAVNRQRKLERVRQGTAHAALVFDGDDCVGWCQFGAPDELPRIKNRAAYEKGQSTPPDWRIACHFVGKGHRRQGVATAALKGALDLIAQLGGGTVEGYPEQAGAVPAGFLFNGALSTYEQLGFTRDRKIGKHRWVVTKVVRPKRPGASGSRPAPRSTPERQRPPDANVRLSQLRDTKGEAMTTLENRPNTALLVIDVQNGIVGGAHERDSVVANVATVVEKARAAQVPVVWVQHSSDNLAQGSEQWQIVPELQPEESEPLVQKRYPDSFEETTLESVLADLAVGRLVVVGAQTDECVRSTLHGALVRGYDATLVSDAHTTEDPSPWGAPPPELVIAHTNLYWSNHQAPGRTAGTVEGKDVDFAAARAS